MSTSPQAPDTQSKSQSSLAPSSPSTSQLHHPPVAAAPSTAQNEDTDLSQAAADDIPLSTLVTHLLASKRSLSSITLVWNANSIVQSARTALEESVLLTSQTTFLRRGITQQARILRKVQNGLQSVYAEGQREFETVLRTLDEADLRLQRTMEGLRGMVVEGAFRPEGEEKRSLLDFVDEGSVEGLRGALKGSIDRAQEHQASFLTSLQAFDTDLQTIKSSLSLSPSASTSASTSTSTHHRHPSKSQEADTPPSPIPHLLTTLESHASEMALLLDSLVHHFDICVTAIKHTSGGYAAVKQAATDNQLPEGLSVSGVINDRDMANPDGEGEAQLEPISEEERLEMLTVLASDAAEVEDVIRELHQRLASMEGQWEQIRDHVSHLNAQYNTTTSAFTLLETIASHLPTYIASSHAFQTSWNESKTLIGEQLDELEGLRDFYEGYLSCYDGLILEVARRRQEEEKMKNVLRKAMEQVRKMWVADAREREAFRRDVGDFLPSDLWPGLVADAPRYEVSVLGGKGDGEGEEGEEDGDGEVQSTPELGREVVEGAIRREKERRKEDSGR